MVVDKLLNKKILTYDEKLELYENNKYRFPPPPVCTARWNDGDWIKFIDSRGEWILK